MEMLAACFKGRFVHVNVNYRYVDEELYYIFDNSDAEAVLYAREFAPQVEALKARLPKVKCFIEVSDDTDVVLDGALSYEALAQNGDGSPLGIPRSGDDLLFLYTGGTTGMPKGVMWGMTITGTQARQGPRPLPISCRRKALTLTWRTCSPPAVDRA